MVRQSSWRSSSSGISSDSANRNFIVAIFKLKARTLRLLGGYLALNAGFQNFPSFVMKIPSKSWFEIVALTIPPSR